MNSCFLLFYLSSIESRQVGGNLAGLPAKAKYNLVTDSEQVPWGKGEKQPGEGGEIEPETIMPTKSQSWIYSVMACFLQNEPTSFFY